MNSLKIAAAVALTSTQVALADTCLPRAFGDFDYNSTNSLVLGQSPVTLRDNQFSDSLDLASVTNNLVPVSQEMTVEFGPDGYPSYTELGDFREAICSMNSGLIKPGDAYLVQSVTFRAQLGNSDFSLDESHFTALNRALLQEGWINLNFYLNTNEFSKLQNGDPEGPARSGARPFTGFNSFENSEQVCMQWVPVWDSENYAVGNIYDVTISGVNVVVGHDVALGISAAHQSMPIRILSHMSESGGDRLRVGDQTSSLEGRRFDVSVSGKAIAGATISTEVESGNKSVSFTHARGFGLQSATMVEGPWRDVYTANYLGILAEPQAERAAPSEFYRLSAGGVPYKGRHQQ